MNRTADILNLPRPSETALAQEYSRPFLCHISWFFGDGEAAFDTYKELYIEQVPEMGGLYPGIAETLQSLREVGFKLAIFSDKRQPYGLPELEQTGVGPLFQHASFITDDRPYKPDPLGLHAVLKLLDVSPGEALYVGDGRQDVECAHRAGVQSGAALWGSVDREGLLASQPHFQWEQADQILDSLAG